jgi:hypothetical protein
VKRIREKALEQFPLLERWGEDDFGWADLMFIESKAMLGAMVQLMNEGIPSLTVHDSLIVPVSKEEIAEQVLREHYLKETGVVPALRVNYPLPSEPAMRPPFDYSRTSSSGDWTDGGDGCYAADSEEENDWRNPENDPLRLHRTERHERADGDEDWQSYANRDEERPGDDYNEYNSSDYF